MKTNYTVRLTGALVMLPLLLWYSCKKDLSKSMLSTAGEKSTLARDLSSVVTAFQTNGDSTKLLQQQPNINFVTYGGQDSTTITVDETTSYQTMDGFGFMLSGGSATLLNGLGGNQASVLNELFGTGTGDIGISYLRISIGASDMSASDFTYDDVAGDTSLSSFSIAPEFVDLVPVLKKILAINPNIKIIATPWSAPAWMKINPTGSLTGGVLNPLYFGVYAKYFVKYIQAMQAQGITITAVTPQNEPINPSDDPDMVMDPVSEALFIGSALGPAISAAGLSTKIICYDYNPDEVAYPLAVLATPTANPYIDGTSFHFYGVAPIGLLSTLHTAFPTKNIYFTEQGTFSNGSFQGDLGFHMNNIVIGAPNNWSKNVLEWVLATDPHFGPHTPGGCQDCKGGITVNGTSITRNVGYYILAHVSKFVRPGAVRIFSSIAGTYIQATAYKNTDGTKVLIAYNSDGGGSHLFKVQWGAQSFTYTLPENGVVTFKWAGTQLAVPPGAPIGQTITLKGFNGQYVNGESGTQPMWCNASSVTAAEQFLVVDAGGGKIALQSQGQYVSSQNGIQSITCDSTSIGPAEKFTWIVNSNGSVSLEGNNSRYVSDEQGTLGLLGIGQIAMTCNRTSISSWEQFTVNQ
jgi:glucosylceramidase